MALSKEPSWLPVIECAISSSIDYEQSIPSVSFCSADMLENCITGFLEEKKACSPTESKNIYTECVKKALKQEKPSDKYLILAQCGSGVGFVSLVLIIPTFVATFFNLVFFAFTLLGFSFLGTCNGYIRKCKLRKKAELVWKEAIQTGSLNIMMDALVQMEQIILNKRK